MFSTVAQVQCLLFLYHVQEPAGVANCLEETFDCKTLTSHSISILDRSGEGREVVFGINVLSQDSTHPICGRTTWVRGGGGRREGDDVRRIWIRMQGEMCTRGVCMRALKSHTV